MSSKGPRGHVPAEVLGDLFAEHHRSLLALLTVMVAGDPETVEDALMVAWTQLAVRPDVVERGSVFPWMVMVARREAWRQGRANVCTAVAFEDLELAASDDVSELAEARDRLARVLPNLKPDELRAMLLKAAGWRYSEIVERERWTYTKVNRCITEGRSRARALDAVS